MGKKRKRTLYKIKQVISFKVEIHEISFFVLNMVKFYSICQQAIDHVGTSSFCVNTGRKLNLEECLFISSVYAYLGMGSVYLSVNILVLLNHVKFCNVDGPDPIKSSIISRDENG